MSNTRLREDASHPSPVATELRRNVTTDEGRFRGAKFAGWCDDAEPKARLVAPDLPPRCDSCAARKGQHLANGSPDTQMLFIDCVMRGEPFYCHDHRRPDQICSGWAMFFLADKGEAA